MNRGVNNTQSNRMLVASIRGIRLQNLFEIFLSNSTSYVNCFPPSNPAFKMFIFINISFGFICIDFIVLLNSKSQRNQTDKHENDDDIVVYTTKSNT